MKKFKLLRLIQNGGIVGVLILEDTKKIICLTLERGWHNNATNVSCIPAGKYICKKVMKENTGVSIAKSEFTYQVTDVPNRTKIMMHIGNTIEDLKGCIAPVEATEGDDTFVLDIENKFYEE
jgi:hypothetical protein